MEESWKESLKNSFTVTTYEDTSAEYLAEILSVHGIQSVQISKIDFSLFLFNFLDLESVTDIVWKELEIWVKTYRKSQLSDLVLPRLTWVTVFGLPAIAVNDSAMQRLLGEDGRVISKIDNLKNLSPMMRNIWRCQSENKTKALVASNMFRWCIGNGKSVYFWRDIWKRDTPLCVSFQRLFNLVIDKDVLVLDMVKIWKENSVKRLII